MPAHPAPDAAHHLLLDRTRARLVADVVAYAAGVPAAQILAEPRVRGPAPPARHLVMYLLSGVFGISQTRIAEALGRDRSTVSYGLRVVEDRRDDPAYDAWVEALEETLRAAPEPPPLRPLLTQEAPS